MELQLRPAAPRFHPLMKPRRGFAGLGTSGYTPAQQAMADAFAAQYGGSTPAVYQAPTEVAVPSCTQDTRPGGAAFSSACIAQLLAAQQQNMQLANNANFVVDYTNCVNQGLDPVTCSSRTYGLTPAGGYTSDAQPQGAPIILDANGNPVSGVPVYTGPALYTPKAPPVTTPSSIRFVNLTSGNAAVLNVGDRWQITITGAAPNAPVSVTGGQNGASATTPMGNTDSSGGWTSNGQITAAQVGSWVEAWTVGGQPVGTFSFTVPGGSSSSSTAPATGGTVTGSFTDLLNKSVTVGGTSIPDWALIGAGLVVLFLVMKR